MQGWPYLKIFICLPDDKHNSQISLTHTHKICSSKNLNNFRVNSISTETTITTNIIYKSEHYCQFIQQVVARQEVLLLRGLLMFARGNLSAPATKGIVHDFSNPALAMRQWQNIKFLLALNTTFFSLHLSHWFSNFL